MSFAGAPPPSARLLSDPLRLLVERAVSAHYHVDWRVRDFRAVAQDGGISELRRLTAALERYR